MWRWTLLLLSLITITVLGLRWLVIVGSALPPEDDAIHIKSATAKIEAAPPVDVTLPMDWRDYPDAQHARRIDYTFEVNLQVPPNRLWGLLLPKAEQNVVVSLNGEIIAAPGKLEPYPSRYINQSLYFVLPNGVLRPGKNLFTVELYTFPQGRGFLDTMLLGPDSVLLPYHNRMTFVKRDLIWFFAALSLAMTIVIGVLAIQRPTETIYGWYAATSGLWTLSSINAMSVEPWLPLPITIAMMSVLAAWFCACAFFFGLRFIQLSMPRFEKLIFYSAVAGTVVVVVAQFIAPTDAYRIAPLATLIQMALGPVVVYQAVRHFVKERDPEVFILLYAAGLIMALGLFSMTVATGNTSGVRGHYLFYSTPIVLGVFVVHLLRRFVIAVRESEALNRELESRIAQKTVQLESNFERMNQLEKERAVAIERERLMRDMHDGVGGQLVSSILQLKNGEQREAVQSSLETALTDLRLMIDSLESSNDLNTALGMLRQRLSQQLQAMGIRIIWHAAEIPETADVSAHATLQVMRIVQEAFTNVLKHAEASEISFELDTHKDHITLTITDNGRGIDEFVRNGVGHGLNNMQRRAADLGAELCVDNIGTGCQVRLTLPITTQTTPPP